MCGACQETNRFKSGREQRKIDSLLPLRVRVSRMTLGASWQRSELRLCEEMSTKVTLPSQGEEHFLELIG